MLTPQLERKPNTFFAVVDFFAEEVFLAVALGAFAAATLGVVAVAFLVLVAFFP